MTLGLIIQLVNHVYGPRDPEVARQLIGFVAGGLLVWGGSTTAAAKGYSPWLGLLGILSFVGMGVLLLIPNRDALRRHAPTPDSAGEAEEDETGET